MLDRRIKLLLHLGVKLIDFYGNNYKVNQIPLSYKNVKKLEESLLLVFCSVSLDPLQKLKKED